MVLSLNNRNKKATSAEGDLPVTADPALEETKDFDIDHSRPSRLGWWILGAGFGGFILWAALAPLDRGVPAVGQVVVEGNRKTVQSLSAGKVIQIRVKDGDGVKEGDVLVDLDATQARSQYEVALSQWFVAKAAEARLLTELTGSSKIRFPEDLLKHAKDPRVAAAITLQEHLLRSRQDALKAEISGMESGIAGLESYIGGVEATKKGKQEVIALLKEEIKGQRELVAEGYLPRNRLSEQERSLAQINAALSEDIANIGRSRQSIAETRMRILARQKDSRKEAETTLSEIQKEASSLDNRLSALKFDLANTQIKSPVNGVVMGLAIHTVGGVINAGMPLMEIVPGHEALKVDVQIPTSLIDKVKVGMPVEIMFPAFNMKTTPNIDGRFIMVSADAITDPQNHTTFYKGQVEVTPEGMKKLKNNVIKAGMPAEIFVKTGERTMLSYLFKPLLDRFHTGLTEE